MRPHRLVIVLVLLAYAAIDHRGVGIWTDNRTLFTRASALAPQKSRPHMNLVKALFGSYRQAEGLHEYETVRRLEDAEGGQ